MFSGMRTHLVSQSKTELQLGAFDNCTGVKNSFSVEQGGASLSIAFLLGSLFMTGVSMMLWSDPSVKFSGNFSRLHFSACAFFDSGERTYSYQHALLMNCSNYIS